MMNWIGDRIVDTAIVLAPTLTVFSAFCVWKIRELTADKDMYRRMARRNRNKVLELQSSLQVSEAWYKALEAKFDRFVDESAAAEQRLRDEVIKTRGGI